jgi:F-type H+-transporting ATPase subunit delta
MAGEVAARRYAQALFDLAQRDGVRAAVEQDLRALAGLLAQSTELRELFEDPILTSERRAHVLRSLLGTRVHELTMRFLLFCVEKRRQHYIAPIIERFQALCDDANGVLHATITVARPLAEDQQRDLLARLRRRTGKEIASRFIVDSSLIGGFRVQLGDHVTDLTLQHQLERLRDTIINE